MTVKFTIKRVKELLGSDKVSFVIDNFDIKTSNSFTIRDANFISKSIAIIIKHYFYKNKSSINRFTPPDIDKAKIETDSDDSNDYINVKHDNLFITNDNDKYNPSTDSIDINTIDVILNRISNIGDPRYLYSSFISLINGEIENKIKYLLLTPLSKCLCRIALRRSPLIANTLASLHTLINEEIECVKDVKYCLEFIKRMWNEQLPDDNHGVANSCLKSFSVQLNEKLFNKIYINEDCSYINCIRELCYNYIKNEGDILGWFISLKTIPNASFRGPLECNSLQESIISFTILEFGYLSRLSDDDLTYNRVYEYNTIGSSQAILPLVYSRRSRGIMAMHSALAIIKSCEDIKNQVMKNCIIKLILWATNEFKNCGYKITSLKGTSWQPIDIINFLELVGMDVILDDINKMITNDVAQ